MLGRGEEDSLSSRKKERRALLFSGENRHGMVSHARSYHRGISSGNDDKMALKINGCVSSALSLFPSIFLSLSLSLSYSCLSFSLFLRLPHLPARSSCTRLCTVSSHVSFTPGLLFLALSPFSHSLLWLRCSLSQPSSPIFYNL